MLGATAIPNGPDGVMTIKPPVTGSEAGSGGNTNTINTGGTSTPPGPAYTSPGVDTPTYCSWYQELKNGSCEFSLGSTAHTVFQLPGSIVVGLINSPKAGDPPAALSEGMMTLATAISLVAWGGLAYYLWRRFR